MTKAGFIIRCGVKRGWGAGLCGQRARESRGDFDTAPADDVVTLTRDNLRNALYYLW